MAFFILAIKPPGYWHDYEKVRDEALKYSRRSDFAKGSDAAYRYALEEGFLDEVCSHMKTLIVPRSHWESKENCRLEALKYKTRTEFLKNANSAYQVSSRKGWLGEVCSHMPKKNRVPLGHWNVFENVQEAALRCNSKEDFKRKYKGAYGAARKHRWLSVLKFKKIG